MSETFSTASKWLVIVSMLLSILIAVFAVLAFFTLQDTADGTRSGDCNPIDPVLADSAFVVVTQPAPGTRVTSPFEVSGCSRTFESTINYELRARNGDVLASGYASGGGVDGAGPFSFAVDYTVETEQVGQLEVFEVDASGGEGFPPGRNVIPLVLGAASAGAR